MLFLLYIKPTTEEVECFVSNLFWQLIIRQSREFTLPLHFRCILSCFKTQAHSFSSNLKWCPTVPRMRTKLFYGSWNGLMSVVQAMFQVSENHHKVYLSASQSSLRPVQLISLRAFKKQQRKFKPVIKIIFQDAWHMDDLFYLCSFSDTVENWIINRFWNAW